MYNDDGVGGFGVAGFGYKYLDVIQRTWENRIYGNYGE